MKYQSRHYYSKNGKKIEIRSAEIEEAQALIDLKRSYLNESETIPLLYSEYLSTFEQEANLISEYQESPNSILLIAYHNGKMIGNIDLTGSPRSRMEHTAMIGMGISTDWQNKGIGSLLMKEAISWAKDSKILQLLWLDVYASNKAGLLLYEKMNFKFTGIIPKFFKHKNDYYDKIQMYLAI